ncbi:MAG: hydroxyacid dehydrogenase [Planctomycetota bacterium]|jgi:(S)-sulfolactate dehydrogenase
MPKIVIPEFMETAAVDWLRARYQVLYDPQLGVEVNQLRAALRDAHGLIVRNGTQVDAALLNAAPALRVVGRLGTGLDNIDLVRCRERGITVRPATGANAASVAEYVITAALMLLRTAWLSTAEVLAGAWPRRRLVGREIAGKTIGLLGYGATARETASRARALGMDVLACDRRGSKLLEGARSVSWSELLRESDVLSLHVPLTEATRGLVSAEAIRQMRPGAVLINAARGAVVQAQAVADALRSGQLSGAALDVHIDEPLTQQAAAIFEDCPGLILTPHIAGVTEESNARVSWTIARAVHEELGGDS